RSAMSVKAAYIMRPHSAASVARAGRMVVSIGCSAVRAVAGGERRRGRDVGGDTGRPNQGKHGERGNEPPHGVPSFLVLQRYNVTSIGASLGGSWRGKFAAPRAPLYFGGIGPEANEGLATPRFVGLAAA